MALFLHRAMDSLRRLGTGGARLFSSLFISPPARIVFALALIVSIMLGSAAQDGDQWVQGWLPGWYPDVADWIAAALAVQPLLAAVGAAVTKKRLTRHLRKGLNQALRDLSERIQDITRIGPTGRWTEDNARNFERQVVQSVQRLLQSVGLPDPRVCLYEKASSDDSQSQEDAEVVDHLRYSYHYPRDIPTQEFDRNKDDGQPDPECAGLFEALDSLRVTRELNRRNFDPEEHHWRSSLRAPVFHERDVWGVLTVDSHARKGTLPDYYDDILAFGARLLAVARRSEDAATPAHAAADYLNNTLNASVATTGITHGGQ